MKKTALILIAIFVALQFSYAQTNTFPSSGNVGIGTTAPSSKLSVGTSVANPTTAALLLSTNGGQFIMENTAAATDTKLWDWVNTGSNFSGRVVNDINGSANAWINVNRTSMAVNSVSFPNGIVGIGTSSPTHTLTLGSTSTGLAAYNTADQTTNYERVRQYWNSNVFTIASEAGGTGTRRSVAILQGVAQNRGITISGGGTTGSTTVDDNNITGGSALGTIGTFKNTSGFSNGIAIIPTVNETSTAGYRGLWISPYEQATGSGSKYLIDAGIGSAAGGLGGHTSKFTVTNTGIGYFAGNVGVGTASPAASLDINSTNAQIRLQGTGASWQGADISITRTNSGDQLGRSPTIGLGDAATGTTSYIQSYQGNLQFWPAGNKTVTMTSDGLVGVNTATPFSTFQVNTNGTKLSIGSANSTTLQGTSYLGFNAARMTDDTWRFDGNLNGSAVGDGGAVMYSDIQGNLNFAAVPTLNQAAYFTLNDTQLKSYISLQLTSAGVLRAKRVKVETGGWPDFVFTRSYKLPSLASVRAFIQKNHRLPDMPAAKEVRADGQDLGEMNRLLLKKVEELTLYLMDEHNKNSKQESRIKALETALKTKNDKAL
ncbi:hypothetical protein [Mucilaginibacter sp. HD30]